MFGFSVMPAHGLVYPREPHCWCSSLNQGNGAPGPHWDWAHVARGKLSPRLDVVDEASVCPPTTSPLLTSDTGSGALQTPAV